MNNIDNRIDDEGLKAAVKGKGIGTEATRADVIEQLIEVGYAERNGKNIVSTPIGRDFINSLPESLKSLERTAEWEQTFNNIKEKGFDRIDCQVKCNKINEKIYKALRGEYENQGVYGDDY